jgi:hypothetical protein
VNCTERMVAAVLLTVLALACFVGWMFYSVEDDDDAH